MLKIFLDEIPKIPTVEKIIKTEYGAPKYVGARNDDDHRISIKMFIFIKSKILLKDFLYIILIFFKLIKLKKINEKIKENARKKVELFFVITSSLTKLAIGTINMYDIDKITPIILRLFLISNVFSFYQ